MTAAAGQLEPVAPGPSATPPQPATPLRYIGLATRVISFTIDAALINVVAVIVGLGASLILSLLHLPSVIKAILVAIGGVAYVVWIVGYFVVFWSTTGQTPGARVMQIRVVTADGGRFKPHRAVIRCVGVLLAALPLFAGFALILFDERRRGFQDRLAGTLVIEAPNTSYIGARRAAKQAASAAPGPSTTTQQQ
jgi:uncharacterized RDD family membrane protein YckC